MSSLKMWKAIGLVATTIIALATIIGWSATFLWAMGTKNIKDGLIANHEALLVETRARIDGQTLMTEDIVDLVDIAVARSQVEKERLARRVRVRHMRGVPGPDAPGGR